MVHYNVGIMIRLWDTFVIRNMQEYALDMFLFSPAPTRPLLALGVIL